MAYRYEERGQYDLFPKTIEEYVGISDPVRAYDAFIEAIDFKDIGIELNENKVGNSEYNPRAMVKLLLYGYSYGERSSRRLERACYHNLSFIWLMGGLKPDHKTIANFRRNNKKSLKNIFKQSVKMCIKLDLIEGNALFLDGTKIRGNAGIKNTWDKKKCEKNIDEIEKRIEKIFEESENIDEEEENNSSLIRLKEELQNEEKLREEVKGIIREIEIKGKERINSTDKDCVNYNSREGSHSGYNGQIVVDEKNGLIVSNDVVNENNDRRQFAKQIEQANANLGKECKEAIADSGYANTDELSKVDEKGIKVIVPTQKQAEDKEQGPFDKSNFKYDSEKDIYICPEGNILKYVSYDKNGHKKIYKIEKKKTCQECPHFGVCTTFQKGRQIGRLDKEEIKEKLEKQYLEEESQRLYKLRKEKVELPFGFLKRNLNFRSFLLRGLEGVKAEFGIVACIFNIVRMLKLVGGVENFVKVAIAR